VSGESGHLNERFVHEKLNHGALEADLKYEVREAEIRFDAGSRALYTTDASNYRQVPIGIVLPKTTEAVIRTLEVCRRHGAPVVSRGGGTGLCGQSCNVAVVIDHSKYLNRILEIDPTRKIARVEPGLILDHLREATQQYKLTYGPDPATHTHNTFGGMIGNNSCGTHSVMSGRTADNVIELDIVTYDGIRMRVGETPEEELNSLIAAGGRRGEIYAGLKAIRDRYGRLIQERYPKIPRRVSGYNLDDLLLENGFNVAKALVGTEGTCITILEATVRLVHSPPERVMVVLGYPSVYQAGDHVMEILEYGPIALEGVDDHLVHYIRKKGLHPENLRLLPEGEGWLVAEFGGDTRQEAEDKARRVMAELRKTSNPPSMKLYDDAEEERHIWKLRESGLGATANVPGMPLSWEGWEDAAVHPKDLGNYLRDFRKLLNRYRYQAALYGHFGQGCIHTRISFDLFTPDGIRKWMSFLDEASDLVVKYGGSFSAEHGDGQSKAIFLPKMYGEELIGAFREFKTLWDPDWKMNPGKVVEPYRPDENLRLGVDYNPWQPETQFKFPDDQGSFSRATLRCVGVGECRRTHNAFMCPSFLVTREEKHSTRGRAHTLFEMFRGEVITDGWRSNEVRDALDLCLACKGCKTDCPVNVDMAMYKAEFLHHYYRRRIKPLPAYSMGLVGFWGRLGSKAPALANFVSYAPFLGSITKEIGGIAPERAMPRFAEQTFVEWFAGRKEVNPEGEEVLLYPDMFNDFFFPDSLKAAALVLERWGFRVVLPPEQPPAIRPPLDYGFIPLAKRNLRKVLTMLRPQIMDGTPMIVLEPSTASIFRDEATAVFPNDHDAHRLALKTFLISEFAVERELALPKLGGKAVFHCHCHQKAVLRPDAARKVLAQMGIEVAEPEPGCCGMAGSFGFEARHYEVSMQIGELNLFPAVRGSDHDSWIVADGFSCRTQILDGTGRKALHMAELILEAFGREKKNLDA
jgi:FAD/FMN-containing dehydrogenase/Fe-S oxidoreductase